MSTSTPLVGRVDERQRLVDALERCRTGRGGIVLVSGETGVGKSRLVSDALAPSAVSQRVVEVAARPGAAAYAPLIDAVDALTGRRPTGPPIDDTSLVDALLESVDDAPTVIVVDDLHIADAATIAALGRLAPLTENVPLLIIGIYRSDGLPRSHPLRALRAQLRRERRLNDIVLAPFDSADTARLLEMLLGTPPARRLTEMVQSTTGGSPFFIAELASALVGGAALVARGAVLDLDDGAGLPMPESVIDTVLTRTADLRSRCAEPIDRAAVMGIEVDLTALASLSDDDRLDALLEDGLLIETDEGRAVFRHGIVREALYRSIPWTRRRRLHALVAEALASRGAPAAVVAQQWIGAHEPARARPLLLVAAEQHCLAHAYRDAAACAGRALALWPVDEEPTARLVALERLADCAELSGDVQGAMASWSELAEQHARAGAHTDAGRAHRRVANAAALSGDLERAARERSEAAEAYSRGGALGDAAEERLLLAEQFKASGRLSDALEQAIAAVEQADAATRTDLRAHALATQGAVRSALGDEDGGVRLARAGLELALDENLALPAGRAYYALAQALEYAADYASSLHAYRSAFELCREHRLDDLASLCLVCLSPVSRLMGDWDRTLDVCAEVQADPASALVSRRVADEESGLIWALRGHARRARAPLRRALDFGRAHGVLGLSLGAEWGLCLVADLEHDDAAFAEHSRRLLDLASTSEETHYSLPALRWISSRAAQHADALTVGHCHRLAAALATRNGSPKVLSMLAHAVGELAVVEGDEMQGADHFARSIDLLSGITSPFEQAVSGMRLGACLAGVDIADAFRRGRAAEALTAAFGLAHRLGATPLATACAEALETVGAPLEQRPGTRVERALVPGGLTRRERDVLQRLAEGGTNREVAARLVVSTRTVDMHVRHLYAKLGCTSRTGAVRAALELGLIDAVPAAD